MDSATDRELEVIRAQAHRTRADLADKLQALESQVSQTVEGVTDAVEAVTETVTNVTESVTETVESVTETVAETAHMLDISPHVQKAPWTAVSCAFATGLASGYFMGSPRSNATAAPVMGAPSMAAPTNGHARENQGPTTLGYVGDTLSELAGSARSLGISALFGVVSHLARNAVPEAMKQDVGSALDKLKTRLGGHHNVNPEAFLEK